MQAKRWDQRQPASTRGQIVALLRRTSRTVNELAEALDLTDNAIRTHLAALERDGLVEQRGVRRGVGKPAYVYDLTPAADALLPKAYAPVLDQLLDVLAERMGLQELEALLCEVGRRAVAGRTTAKRSLREGIDAAVDVLGELGGVADVEESDGRVYIRGYSCPLAAVVPGHPEVCQLAEALLTEVTGVPVHQCCDRGVRPRCRFEVTPG